MDYKITKNFFTFLFLSTLFFFIFLIFYHFENKYFLENEITPWDGSVYKNIIIMLNNPGFEMEEAHFLHPHSSKILFLYLTRFLADFYELSIIKTMYLINIVSSYLLFIIIFYFLGFFRKNFFLQLIFTLLLFFLWNSQLRMSIYNPSYPLAFNTLLISLSTISIFFLIEKRNISSILIVILFVILLTLQRHVVIFSIVTITLILAYICDLKLNNRFLISFKTFLNIKGSDNFKNIKIKLFIILILIILFSFFLKAVALKGGTYTFFKMIIKFSYFHLHPLEFLYSFYYAFGALFVLFLPNLILKKLRDNLFLSFTNLSVSKKLIFISILLSSILLGNVGGDDSSRFLMWFSPWFIVLFYISAINILKFHKLSFLIILIPFYILGARVIIPGIPVYNFSYEFPSQFVYTNYDDKYYYGPKFLKKFRNEIVLQEIDVLPDFYDQNIKTIFTGVPKYLMSNKQITNQYIQPYKYRINDIPFPLGYLHNQKKALVDHPWHGETWVRFALIIQWLILQLIYTLMIKHNEK